MGDVLFGADPWSLCRVMALIQHLPPLSALGLLLMPRDLSVANLATPHENVVPRLGAALSMLGD